MDTKQPLPESAAEFMERALVGDFEKLDTEGLPKEEPKKTMNINLGDSVRKALELSVCAELATMNRKQRRGWLSNLSRRVGKQRAKIYGGTK